MVQKSDDGGQAFPSTPASGNYGYQHLGMSLRDWLTGQALIGILARPVDANSPWRIPSDEAETARWALEIADAVLKEKAK